MSVYLLATLDTKGREAAFVRDELLAQNIGVVIVDCGCLGAPDFPGDVTRDEVFAAAHKSLTTVQTLGDRGFAIVQAAAGAAKIVADAFVAGKLTGVLALGGSAGTNIGTAAMRALPLGVPKLMVSTLASGDVSRYVGAKDICMLNSVVDIAGLNRISRPILSNAAAAMAGMVRRAGDVSPLNPATFRELTSPARQDRPIVCATMFGVTTPCVQHASKLLEAAGYEVIVFHATGSGGRAMESLIAEGLVAGVLDITTTELADELVGGILSAGPDRLTAAVRAGIPQVVSVGALDMVNFGPRETVPQRFAERKFHIHNPTVTLMRTTVDENAKLGEELARKVAASTAPAVIMLPLHGISAIDRAGQSFDDPAARDALFTAIRAHRGNSEIIELDAHINDASFAEAAAAKLLALIAERSAASGERQLPESAPKASRSVTPRTNDPPSHTNHTHNQGAYAPRSPAGANAPFYRDCDRFWFLTWTTYGTWLPGDERGFVSNATDETSGETVRHNVPDTPYDADDAALRERSIANLKCPPIYLLPAQAEQLFRQFEETSAQRGWLLLAAAVMCNHVHLVIGVPGDPDAAEILRDYKAYGSRTLNRRWPKPASDTWWTESGSKRKLPHDNAVAAAVQYVRYQHNPLVVWIHPSFLDERSDGDGERGASAP